MICTHTAIILELSALTSLKMNLLSTSRVVTMDLDISVLLTITMTPCLFSTPSPTTLSVDQHAQTSLHTHFSPRPYFYELTTIPLKPATLPPLCPHRLMSPSQCPKAGWLLVSWFKSLFDPTSSQDQVDIACLLFVLRSGTSIPAG